MNDKNLPDYSVYHLHELEAALKSVDESANPDEAKLIRGFINKGGYQYPTRYAPPSVSAIGPAIKEVSFVSAGYRAALILVVGALLWINFLTFLSWHNPLVLIPIAFQGAILILVFLNHKYARALIKAWCSFLIVSGLSGLVAMYLSDSFPTPNLLWHVITFAVGLSFLLLANRYVHLVSAASNLPLNEDANLPATRPLARR